MNRLSTKAMDPVMKFVEFEIKAIIKLVTPVILLKEFNFIATFMLRFAINSIDLKY